MNPNSNGATKRSVDSDIVRRAQQGDRDAFAVLFHAHKARVYSLCLRMTNNVAEAEDLTQDAFLMVFRKLPAFRGDSALSTWLHRIAFNTVLMHFRKKSPCKVSLDEPRTNTEDDKPVPREFGVKDGRLETSVSRIALTRAISELPQGYRRIFLMHQVEGYEHHEIAKLLGCSVGNTKSQLHKAKLRIRHLLRSVSAPAPEPTPLTRSVSRRSSSQRTAGDARAAKGRVNKTAFIRLKPIAVAPWENTDQTLPDAAAATERQAATA